MKDKAKVSAILAEFRFDPWNMMGNYNRKIRQTLIDAITGEIRPLAKCGVTEIEKELCARVDMSAATCRATFPDCFKAALS